MLTSSKSEREKKDYVIKIIRSQLEPATKNEYEETIKMFIHNNSRQQQLSAPFADCLVSMALIT